MTDIIERLRDDTRSAVHCSLSEEAADEIDRLRRRVVVLEMVIDEELDQYDCEDAANEMIVKEIHDRGYVGGDVSTPIGGDK